MKGSIESFERRYIVAATIICLYMLLTIPAAIEMPIFLIIPLTVISLTLYPIVKNGGVPARPRVAIIISTLLTLATGGLSAAGYFNFMITNGSEGPNGEGSPLAVIILLAMWTLCIFCPWLIATLRGWQHWNTPGEIKPNATL